LTLEDVKTLKLQLEAFLYLLDKRNVRRDVKAAMIASQASHIKKILEKYSKYADIPLSNNRV
jgi:predicted HTH domain antitoxin